MEDKKALKRLTIELDEDTFYSLKSYCLLKKTTIRSLITNIIKKQIEEE